jgi:hypothetical protein
MHILTATIGRGAPGADNWLKPDEWSDFQSDLLMAFADAALTASLFEHHSGIGRWQGEDEESFKVALGWEVAPNRFTVQSLLRRIGALKTAYRQDAIAITEGESRLI